MNADNILFEHCRFKPMTPSADFWDMCIRGHDFTLRRCDLSGTVDGVAIHGSPSRSTTIPANVSVEGCYIHDLVFWCPHPPTGDNRTHSDCIQLHHSSGHREVSIFGNRIDAFADPSISTWSSPTFDDSGVQQGGFTFFGEADFYGDEARYLNACIIFAPESEPLGHVRVEKNWLDGATNKIGLPRCGTGATFGSRGFEIVGNRFGRRSRGASYGTPPFTYAGHIAKRQSCPVTISDNIVIGQNDEFIEDYNTFTSLGG